MTGWELIGTVVLGLAINETVELSPWLAKRVVRVAARLRYGKTLRAEVRKEEWDSIIEQRPGKLFKLLTALGFLLIGILGVCRRFVRHISAVPLYASAARTLLRGGVEYVKSGGSREAVISAKLSVMEFFPYMARVAVRLGHFPDERQAMSRLKEAFSVHGEDDAWFDEFERNRSAGGPCRSIERWHSPPLGKFGSASLLFSDLLFMATLIGKELIKRRAIHVLMKRIFHRGDRVAARSRRGR